MASAAATLNGLDALAKDQYLPAIIEQYSANTLMLDQIQRDSTSVTADGRRWIAAVQARLNPSGGNIADGGTLHTPGAGTYVDAIDTITYRDAGFSITDQAIAQLSNGQGSFANVLTRETQQLTLTLKRKTQREVWGSGGGLLGTVASNANSTTQTLDSVQYVEIGDTVDVVTIADGTVVASSRTVTARSAANKTITVSGAAVNATTAEGIYLAGSRNLAMPGLRNLVNTTGTVHGIDRSGAGNDYWKSQVIDVSSASFAGEDHFQQLYDKIAATARATPENFVTTQGVRRRLANSYTSQKRFNDAQATKIQGGYTAIYVNDTPVLVDLDCPKGEVFALNKESFRWFEVKGPDWLQKDGGSIWQLLPGANLGTYTTQWAAWVVWYASLGTLAPNRNGRLTGAADDAAV